ncbi:integrin alpha-PS4-like [Macrobrachium nipponense]|uniref:integrin alpha-PS4-like n=1 Tax=Macrobrachium nipponense TaxID=159736 RepID=UPI0030C8012C
MTQMTGLCGSVFLLPASWIITWLSISSTTLAFNLEPESAQIFTDPTVNQLNTGRQSYFGFSVALQRNALSNSNWLVVGAPRANSSMYIPTQITEPGVIFKCDLQKDKTPCQELRIDQTGNQQSLLYHDLKNFGWLGSSLDSQPSREDNRQATATCAPRWKNQYFTSQSLMNGVCYWLNASLPDAPSHKLLPLLNYDKQTFQTFRSSVYFYSHGQAGMSVHFPDSQNEMIIGAPGLLNWQGSVILLRDSVPFPNVNTFRQPTASEDTMFKSALVPNPYYTYSTEDFELTGYAVTSGRFFNKNQLLYVTGAPRGASMHGKVLIFSFPDNEVQSLNIWVEWRGSQLGENFGASLVTADVNGDGLSDLIVGSPTYSEPNKPDTGRIQVFIGTTEGNILKISSHSGSSQSLARFGTTLAPSGDINHDSYEDVAVGAPWEDDGRGAVYIYLGSIFGLRKEFSQRLTPDDFPSYPLRGLGMSISRGIDIDNNGYPDLAIGSFISGHALVLRSRTVASIKGHLESNPPALQLDTTEFSLTACIIYTGYKVPASVDVPSLLTLDYGHHAPRASFSDTKRTVKNVTLKATIERVECKTFQVSTEANKINPRRPIIVSFEYAIPDIPGRQLYQPKTDNTEPQSFTYPIRIVTDCEDNGNNICEIDLHVEADFRNFRDDENLVIGGIKRPELEISVSNLGESVFLPNVSINVPEPFVLFMPISHSCQFASKGSRSHLVCQLKNPILRDNKDTLVVIIDPSQITDATQSTTLTVNVEAAGEGTEIQARDNRRSTDIQLLADAELKLQGYSRAEQILYPRLDENTIDTNEPTASFTHYYSLVKSGPTPIERIEFVIDIPVNLTGNVNFITLYTPETNFLDQPFFCNIEGATPKVRQFRNGERGSDTDTLLPTEVSVASKVKRSTKTLLFESNKEAAMHQNSTYDKPQVFSCANSDVSCAKVRCLINSWPGESRSASFSIRMEVNFVNLASHMSARVGASVMSTARASIISLNPTLVFQGNKTTSTAIETILVPLSLPEKQVAWWIILLAVLGGLLLLILLAVALYKFGFFRRKKQEEMKAHRAHVESQSGYGATTNGDK